LWSHFCAGEKLEMKGEMLKAGSLWVYPAKHAHYAWTGNTEYMCVVAHAAQVGTAREEVDYINPADDPRKKTTN
jgi:hypothetical protein